MLLVTAENGTVDDADVHDAAVALPAKRLDREPGVAQTQSYWSLDNAPPLRSDDGRTGVVLAALAGDARRTHRSRGRAERRVRDRTTSVIRGEASPAKSPIEEQISEQAEKDLQRSELLTAPLIFIAL